MVFILVFLTAGVCLLVDWLLHRSEHFPCTDAGEVGLPPAPLAPPQYVGGFRVQSEMFFHPGHTWVLLEGPDRVRVGMDDLAGHLIGYPSGVRLPLVGERLVQGKPGWRVEADGLSIPFLSPVSGKVRRVNTGLPVDPDAVRRDPYGAGWTLLVQPDDLGATLNNLLSGELVRRWMEDACSRLRTLSDRRVTLSFPDGGAPLQDLAGRVPGKSRNEVLRSFLLTEPDRIPDKKKK